MIKLTKRTYKRALTEFRKGKAFWFAERNNLDPSETRIICFNWMEKIQKELKMNYNQYTVDGSKEYGPEITPYSDWNWIDYNFYILNKKEIEPYYKKILAEQIISQSQ